MAILPLKNIGYRIVKIWMPCTRVIDFIINDEITVWCQEKPSCDDSGKNWAERGKQRMLTMQRNREVVLNLQLGKCKYCIYPSNIWYQNNYF